MHTIHRYGFVIFLRVRIESRWKMPLNCAEGDDGVCSVVGVEQEVRGIESSFWRLIVFHLSHLLAENLRAYLYLMCLRGKRGVRKKVNVHF